MNFDGAIPVGAVYGVRVKVHISFLAVIALVSAQVFHQLGFSGALWFSTRIGLVVLCFLIHELGHAFAARFLGVRVYDVVLGPFGGMARLERLPVDPNVELLIAAAGPAANLAFFAVLLPIQALDGGGLIPAGGVVEWTALEYTVVIHAVMGVVNLIPAFPMDGGRILRAMLSRRIGSASATRRAVFIGRVLAIMAVIPAFLDPRLLAIGFVGIFIWFAGSRELRMLRHSALALPDAEQRKELTTDDDDDGDDDEVTEPR